MLPHIHTNIQFTLVLKSWIQRQTVGIIHTICFQIEDYSGTDTLTNKHFIFSNFVLLLLLHIQLDQYQSSTYKLTFCWHFKYKPTKRKKANDNISRANSINPIYTTIHQFQHTHQVIFWPSLIYIYIYIYFFTPVETMAFHVECSWWRCSYLIALRQRGTIISPWWRQTDFMFTCISCCFTYHINIA